VRCSNARFLRANSLSDASARTVRPGARMHGMPLASSSCAAWALSSGAVGQLIRIGLSVSCAIRASSCAHIVATGPRGARAMTWSIPGSASTVPMTRLYEAKLSL
jgi:hypothetical protein